MAQAEMKTRQCLLDWFGVIYSAHDSAPEVSSPLVTGDMAATDILRGRRLSIADAAFSNAFSAHLMDFDDCHKDVPGHASVTVISAVVATAEATGANLGLTLRGIAAGVEVAAMLGRHTGREQYDAGWHPTATLGSIAASVAASVVHEQSLDEISDSASLGALQASGLLSGFGSYGKSWQVGCAARNGVQSSFAVESGITGLGDQVGGTRGALAVMTGVPEQGTMTSSSHEPLINLTIFKYYASCFGTHAAAACVEDIRSMDGFDESKIVAIDVGIGGEFRDVILNPQPQNNLEAKFSVSAVTALALLGRPPTEVDFFSTPVGLQAEYQRLEQLVRATVDTEIVGGGAHVTVILANGACLRSEMQEAIPGNTEDEWEKLIIKFKTLAVPVVGIRAAESIVQFTKQADASESIADFITRLMELHSEGAPANGEHHARY